MISLLKGDRLFYVGQAILYLKSGSIEILGKIIHSTTTGPMFPIKIVSHPNSCIMYICSLSDDVILELASIKSDDDDDFGDEIFKPFLKGSPESFITYTNEEDVKRDFPLTPILVIPAEWNEFKQIHSKQQHQKKIPKKERKIILISGPRKVGKSMLAKYISNTILNTKPSCIYLDLDMGQTEFTPPGFFSFSKLSYERFLIGPPIRHSHYADKSIFIGSNSLDTCPQHCINAFEVLWSILETKEEDVCINTLGWVSGLGLSFLQYILQRTIPTHVISIKARNNNNNDSSPISHEVPAYVWEAMYECNNLSSSIKPLTPEEGSHVSIASLTSTFERIPHSNVVQKLRSLSWMGYFISLKEVVVPFSKISINLYHNCLLDDFDLSILLSLLNFATVGVSKGRFDVNNGNGGNIFLIMDSLMVKKKIYLEKEDCIDVIGIIKGINPLKKELCLTFPSSFINLREDSNLILSFRAGFLVHSSFCIPTIIPSTSHPYQSSFGAYSSQPQNRRVRNNVIRRSHF